MILCSTEVCFLRINFDIYFKKNSRMGYLLTISFSKSS